MDDTPDRPDAPRLHAVRGDRSEPGPASDDFTQALIRALRDTGAAVIPQPDAQQREHIRAAAQAAGETLGRTIRAEMVDSGDMGIWDDDRQHHPLHAQLDEKRATRQLDEAYRRLGPLTGRTE